MRDGAAYKAGLKTGDILISLDGTPAYADHVVKSALDGRGAGDVIRVRLRRFGVTLDHEVLDAEVTLQSPAASTEAKFLLKAKPDEKTLQHIQGSPFHFTVRPPGPDPPKCRAFGDGLSEARSGEPTGFTVVLNNSRGAQLSYGGYDVQGVIRSEEERAVVQVSDNGDGTYLATYTVQGRGKYVLAVWIEGVQIGLSPFDVVVSGVHPPSCSASGHGLRSVVVGDVGTFELAARAEDGYLLRIPEGSRAIQIEILRVPEGSQVAAVPAEIASGILQKVDVAIEETDRKGHYTLQWRPKEPGRHLLSLNIYGKSIRDSPFEIEVTTGPANAQRSVVIPSHAGNLEPILSCDEATLAVVLHDRFGNKLSRGGDSVTVAIEASDGTAPHCVVTDQQDGTYHVAYNVRPPGRALVAVSCNGQPFALSPYPLTVLGADPKQCQANGDGLTSASAGTPAEFDFFAHTSDARSVWLAQRGREVHVLSTATDRSGPAELVFTVEGRVAETSDRAHYRCTYTAFRSGPTLVSVMLGPTQDSAVHIPGSPFSILVTPAKAFARRCIADGPGLSDAFIEERAAFRVLLYDEYGNRLRQGGSNVSACLEYSRVETSDVPCDIPVTVSDNGDGSYASGYTAKVPGLATLHVFVDSEPIGTSPYEVHVFGAHVPSCSASGPGLISAVAGEPAQFTVLTKSHLGRPIGLTRMDELEVSVVVTSLCGTRREQCTSVIDRQGSAPGQFAVTYTSLAVGNADISVRIFGEHIPHSPFAVPIRPGRASPLHSKAAGIGLEQAICLKEATFCVSAFDCGMNPQPHTRVAVVIVSCKSQFTDEAARCDRPVAKVSDQLDGRFFVSYTPRCFGLYEIDVQVDGVSISAGPFSVDVLTANPPNCMAFGDSIIRPIKVGTEVLVHVNTRTAFDETVQLADPSNEILFCISREVGGELGAEATVGSVAESLRDGHWTYSCKLFFQASGVYQLAITVHGQHIGLSPMALVVAAAESDPLHSEAFATGLHTAVRAAPQSFTVQVTIPCIV
jgi:hypothetical protein